MYTSNPIKYIVIGFPSNMEEWNDGMVNGKRKLCSTSFIWVNGFANHCINHWLLSKFYIWIWQCAICNDNHIYLWNWMSGSEPIGNIGIVVKVMMRRRSMNDFKVHLRYFEPTDRKLVGSRAWQNKAVADNNDTIIGFLMKQSSQSLSVI